MYLTNILFNFKIFYKRLPNRGYMCNNFSFFLLHLYFLPGYLSVKINDTPNKTWIVFIINPKKIISNIAIAYLSLCIKYGEQENST